MAQFPTSVKTFTPRSNGQTIDASHVNDIQDEVSALEDGYLNGTARLNAANSTVANLSVTGGSTLATLSVSGVSTFTVRPTTPPPDAVRVTLASTVTVVDGVPNTLSWGTQIYITNSSLHSVGVNSSRVTPQSTGLYEISFQATFSQNSSGSFQLLILDSSGASIGVQDINVSRFTKTRSQVHATKRVDVVGTWFAGQVFQQGASTLSLLIGEPETWFEVRKL